MRRIVCSIAAVALTAGFAAPAAAAPGRYIVVLKDSVADPAQHARASGAAPTQVYTHALKGWAATLPDSAVAGLERDPRVAYVTPDTELTGMAAAECTDLAVCQRLPNPVNRIDGDVSSTRSGDGRGAVNVNVAVLDSGVASHPDLNLVGGVNCSSGQGYDDVNDHGTGVAGLIGAIDNSIYTVGVAPGARIWAVRVLDKSLKANTSQILCGVDWVTATRTDGDRTNDIAVANMSLGQAGDDDGNCGRSNRDAIHQAICASTAAGVTYVAAAGNSAIDLGGITPASYDEVLAVTGIDDADGLPGGAADLSAACSTHTGDDIPAAFSNFATQAADAAHTVAASAVCDLTVFPGPTFGLDSGTSYASPQVAGTVALCIASGSCAGLTPAQIRQKIVADAAAYNSSRRGLGYGFAGDPLHAPDPSRYYGYLIRAGLY